MIARIFPEAEEDLESAYDHYERLRPMLGGEMVDEFRRAVERILKHPHAWQPMDETYRRCRLHRFPYGIIYRVDAAADEVVIIAIMHLSQKPGGWRSRQ